MTSNDVLKSTQKTVNKSKNLNFKTTNMKNKFIELKNRVMMGKQWLKISNWIYFSLTFMVVGFIIFILSTFTNQPDGELASYYMLAIGLIFSLIMTLVFVSRETKGKHMGIFNLMKQMIGLVIPSIVTLIPVITLIVIFHEVKRVLVKDSSHLPGDFYLYHYITYIFLFMQIILLFNFFKGEIKDRILGIVNTNRNVYMSLFVLTSLITMMSVGNLYVIITKFITDG